MKPESNTENQESPAPEISKNRKISAAWIIPIIGVLLGIWFLQRNHEMKGPLIQVTFEDANRIVANKTQVRCRSVIIGKVETVDLDSELNVSVKLRIDKEFAHLVRKESRFWVARPRVTFSGVSGLETIISGSYIGLDPGKKKGGAKKEFVGLESPPITPSSIPGLRLKLKTSEPGPIDLNSLLYFQGSCVGKVESRSFDVTSRETTFGVFIEEKFVSLINTETRFWRDSGPELNIGDKGFELKIPSVDSLISGRIDLGVPSDIHDGAPVEDGETFTLFNAKELAEASTFDHADEFLILVNQSVRGLSQSAPVEFRGLLIGRVTKISYETIEGFPVTQVPILIQLDRRLLAKHFPLGLKDGEYDYLEKATKNGLRASLKSNSILTGKLIVDFDYYPDIPAEPISKIANYKVLPTAESGLSRIEDGLAAALNKINKLPIEPLLIELEQISKEGTVTMQEIRGLLDNENGFIAKTEQAMTDASATLKSLQKILDNKDINEIPTDLRATLAELKSTLKQFSSDGNVHGDLLRTLEEIRSTARSIERTSDAIGDKPNSLLFGKDKSSKAIPRAKQ